MTLNQQFLILAVFPLSFWAMLLYLWRAGRRHGSAPHSLRPWFLFLALGSVWASSVLRMYGGDAFSPYLIFGWGVVRNYTFSFMALTVLLTTVRLLSMPRGRGAVALFLSGVLLLASLALDPAIWGRYLPPLQLVGVQARQLDLWAGVWVAGWLLALLAAWLMTAQVRRRLPLSSSLNQLNYWSLMLLLFMVGGGVAAVQQPRQPVWQEAGLLIIVPAALLGTLSLAHSQLPDLALGVRVLLRRLASTLVIFGLMWLALWGMVQVVGSLPQGASVNLLLVLAAALFAVLFTAVYRVVNDVTQRIFLPQAEAPGLTEAEYNDLLAALPQPQQLAQTFTQVLARALGTVDVWLFVATEEEGGGLALRPFATPGSSAPPLIYFAPDSPFARTMRARHRPLLHQDMAVLPDFATQSAAEREMLDKWQRLLYVPILLRGVLEGVIMLGERENGAPYEQRHFAYLLRLVERFGPLLVQARHLAQLQEAHAQLRQQQERMQRENQQLAALSSLYGRFLAHISPDLKRPLRNLREQLASLQHRLEPSDQALLQARLDKAEEPLDWLLQTAARLQNREQFQLQMVRLDDIARVAQRRLHTMAEARQVHIEFSPHAKAPPILADEAQLTEAVQHLLHNAIKFNRVGGTVNITCGSENGEVYLQISDQGVGIPEAQLKKLWQEFPTAQADLVEGGGKRRARLGLMLAQFVAQAHGGRLEAHSTYGVGSVFSLYIPVRDDVSAGAT